MSSVRHCTLVRSWAAERRTNSNFLLGAIFCTANKSVSTQWSAGVAVSRVVRPSNITAARAAAAAAATATTTTTSAMWKIVMVSSTCALFAPTGQSSPPRRRVQSGAYFCTRVHGKARVRELLMALQIVLRCYTAVWSCSYLFCDEKSTAVGKPASLRMDSSDTRMCLHFVIVSNGDVWNSPRHTSNRVVTLMQG